MDRHEQAARNQALFARRRPQDFAPWEAEYPEGCKLREAIRALVAPPWRKSVSDWLADMDVGLLPEQWPVMEDHFWRHILYRLQAGELTMRARSNDDHQMEDIPADMLDDAVPDFGNNRITCCGTTFFTVRIFEVGQVASKNDLSDAGVASGFPGRPTSQALIRAEMLERAKQGQLAPTLAGEAQYLSDWLRTAHPDQPQATPKTIRNSLSKEYRRLSVRP